MFTVYAPRVWLTFEKKYNFSQNRVNHTRREYVIPWFLPSVQPKQEIVVLERKYYLVPVRGTWLTAWSKLSFRNGAWICIKSLLVSATRYYSVTGTANKIEHLTELEIHVKCRGFWSFGCGSNSSQGELSPSCNWHFHGTTYGLLSGISFAHFPQCGCVCMYAVDAWSRCDEYVCVRAHSWNCVFRPKGWSEKKYGVNSKNKKWTSDKGDIL